jgi:hypothetical protein
VAIWGAQIRGGKWGGIKGPPTKKHHAPHRYSCKTGKMWYFLGHTNGIFKKSDKKIENMQNNPCHWACFQKVKNILKKKKQVFLAVFI